MDQPVQIGMLSGKPKVKEQPGCCHSKHTKNCCIATGVFGSLFLILGVIVLLMGKGMLENAILKSMALTPGSDRLKSWLVPPVEAYMEAYAFHVTNPEEILSGRKPVVEERGPYVYKSITVKDSDNNMQWHDSDGTLTYRPRKVYNYLKYDPENPDVSSCPTCDPDKDFMTFPNIPYWTGLNGARKTPGWKKTAAIGYVTGTGRNTPFINVTLSGLLWGYEDELPCLRIQDQKPSECESEDEGDMFDDDYDDVFGEEDELVEDKVPKDSKWEKLVTPKAEYVDCKCNWGLFRDRNITMRKPVRFYTGQNDQLDLKGIVTRYNGKTELGWWQEGSLCDKVKGQDASTLPPGLNTNSSFEVFIALMCRTLKMNFEKEVEHAGIKTLRFIPPPNALGTHDDQNAAQRNEENKCYDLKNEQGITNYKSGVLNLENCKKYEDKDTGDWTFPPLALSAPHFYQADPSFRSAVKGLTPNKEKHQFYIDVVPQFGFPLAMMAQFQLNLVIFREEEIPELRKMENEVVLPFLWAGLGFKQPSTLMADQIKVGLAAPKKFPLLIAVVLFALGGALLLTTLGYFLWRRRNPDTVAAYT